jgi:Tfp pilus assembly protein PilV
MWHDGHRSDGFLLVEVLVAFAVFVMMVGVFTLFINVWLTTDLEQRRRQDALTAVSNCLECLTAGLMLPKQPARSPVTVQVQPVRMSQAFAAVPAWVEQLSDDERPRVHQVIATGPLYRGRQVTVQVTG